MSSQTVGSGKSCCAADISPGSCQHRCGGVTLADVNGDRNCWFKRRSMQLLMQRAFVRVLPQCRKPCKTLACFLTWMLCVGHATSACSAARRASGVPGCSTTADMEPTRSYVRGSIQRHVSQSARQLCRFITGVRLRCLPWLLLKVDAGARPGIAAQGRQQV